MGTGAWIGLTVGLVVMGLGFAVAFTARRSYVGRNRPSRLLSLTTDRSSQEVREALLALAQCSKYKLEEDKPEHQLVTLSSRPTAFSWGFFFPIYIEPQKDGPTQLTIGIESKVFQYGPIVTHHHQACFTTVRDALAR